jgi:HAE1 family hydrophobic/amphiphilic exporter-1
MSLPAFATRRRVTVAMATIAVLLFGTVALSRLSVNLLPDLAHPALTVRTELEGAAPAEIETLISKPVEEAVGVVKNVEEVRSVSRTGQSDVVLTFGWGTNMDYASLDVREKLDALALPLEAGRPSILRFDPALDPILRFALVHRAAPAELTASAGDDPVGPAARGPDEAALKALRRYADEELKRVLESAAGVAAVKVSGGLEDEVQIDVDPARLSQVGLSIEQVSAVLGAENVNRSGGRIEQGSQQYLVRTLNQFGSVAAFEDVILATQNGVPIYLRDVAAVRLGARERESISRMDGREAVEIAVYKEGDANTVAAAGAVRGRLAPLREQLPADMELAPIYDQSVFIESAVDEVIQAGLLGGLLAILVLFLFLRDVKTTLIVGLTIPTSVVATFNLMYGADLSLNVMSLGGLALGIGLLVDNAIVVLENIARHREEGRSARDAARLGTGEVGMAITASTLTTIAVFGPLVFVDGIAGQLFRDQALTVTFSLLASLIAALTLIPMLASFSGASAGTTGAGAIPWPRRPSARRFRAVLRHDGWGAAAVRTVGFGLAHGPWALGTLLTGLVWGLGWAGTALVRRIVVPVLGTLFAPVQWAFTRGYEALAHRYPPLLRAALARPALVLVAAGAMLGGSLLLVPSLGVELIPRMAQNEFTLELHLPPGTPLAESDATLARLQAAAATTPAVARTFAVAGTGSRMDANPDQGGENWGEMHVRLDGAAGPAREAAAVSALRRVLDRLPGAEYELSRPALFTLDMPIEVEVAGHNLDHLRTTAAEITRRLAASPRFADVQSSLEQGHPEVQIHFDRGRATALGLVVHEVADRVVQQVRGEVATRYSWRDRKIDVRVRAQAADRATVRELRRLIINDNPGRPIPLSAIADVRVDVGPSQIRRVAQQRVALVRANLQYGDLGEAITEINDRLADVAVPAGLSTRIGGQSEDMNESFRSLLFAMALALFLVYLVMASQFESLLYPFVIFFSIPLAAVGALWALWLTATPISVIVFIGLILLAGIVVNNAIVLIDLVNQLRAAGTPLVEALVEGGRLRLRPILMTTLTTTLGLLPLALGVGDGAELRAPMAIPVIGGLVVSTLLTLVVVPVLYKVLSRPAAPAPPTP